MSTVKRCISLLLVMVILMGVFSPAAQAASSEETASVNTDNVTIEGTNGFGNLLSQEIAESQEEAETAEAEYPGGYTVTDLVIEGNTATVTYDTMEEATLIVALYTEDGMQMVTSTAATVTPDTTEAELIFEGDMPDYFMASAYLLDAYDFSPLCAAYDTPMYTQEMQALLDSTANDYDSEKVLNLDDDETTNFAVYADSTIIIEPIEGVNVVASVDEETLTYVIENADATISRLVEGDVFVYRYKDDEILIVKVSTITTDGTTSTITGAQIEMKDVFSAVKIEGKSDTNEVVVDDSTADQGVAFEGIQAKGTPGYGTDSLEGGGSFEYELVYKIDKTANYGSITEKIEGKLGIGLETSIDYYISGNRQFIEFAVDYYLLASISAEGTLKTGIPLGKFSVVPVFGVYCYFEPELSFEAKGAVEIEIKCGSFTKTVFESGKGLTCYVCDTGCTFDGTKEIEYFIGLDLNPGIAIIDKAILNMQLSAKTGLILTVKQAGKNAIVMDSSSEVIHSCNICFDLELSFSAEFKVTMFLLGCKERAIGPVKLETLIFEAYRSTDYDEFLPGNCPHLEYRITFQAIDAQGNGIGEIAIYSDAGDLWGTTNKHGVLNKYLPKGTYDIEIRNGTYSRSRRIQVNEPAKIVLNLSEDAEDTDYSNIIDHSSYWEQIDYGPIRYSGVCGDNLIWKMYDGGVVKIEGTGDMYDYDNAVYSPFWAFRKNITSVIICNGVTSIGDWAICRCDSIKQYVIPPSVKKIGYEAFTCDVQPPSPTTYISDLHAWCNIDFDNMLSTPLYYGKSLYLGNEPITDLIIPRGVTEVKAWAFYSFNDMKSVTIPKTVTRLGFSAFGKCTNLSSVTIPSSVTFLASDVFVDCAKLNTIIFQGNAPTFYVTPYTTTTSAFKNVTATVYYPADNTTWTSDVLQNHGGTLTWIPYTLDEEGNMITTTDGSRILVPQDHRKKSIGLPDSGYWSFLTKTVPYDASESSMSIDAVYGGEYGSVVSGNYVCKTASFSNLVPDQQYVLLSLVGIENQEPLTASNLLYIDQAVAGEDGSLSFTYVQREAHDVSYVFVCGASNKDLNNAEINFPEMNADGELEVVNPTIIYDGKLLIEGQDYVVVGTVDFSEAGEYTCYIRGIRNYTGFVECDYTVVGHSHSFTNFISDENASCTNDGTMTAKCDSCDAIRTIVDVGSALGHSFGDWIVIQEPTTLENGLEERRCFRCGHTEQRTVSKLENPFNDVAPGSFYYEPVMWAVENGITNGTSATTFGPNDQCMRAHVVTFLWRAVGCPEPTKMDNPFVDVKSTDFYYKPVLWAVENGITSGMDATHFGPTAYCNRAQVVTFLYRTVGSPAVDASQNPFTDVPTGQWFTAPVLWAVENGITNGVSTTTFGPNTICNRAQIVTFLYRAFA